MESYGSASFYLNLKLEDNPKSKDRFIHDIERIIRTSLEYRNYIKYLKTEVMLNYCSIMNKLPEEVIKKITLEMHHYPFTLYDLVNIVLTKHFEEGSDFTRLSIANEVMEMHYFLQVGIVPLTKTVHELAHTNSIKININHVIGNYKKLIDNYLPYIDPDKREIIKEIEERSLNNGEYFTKINKVTLELNPELFVDEEIEENLDDEFINA